MPATNEILYVVNVTADSYIAAGYGDSMTDTDMVSWIANGAASYQQDMYATGQQKPNVLSQNAYNTTFVDDTSTTNSVVFTSTRSMTATD